MKVIIRKSKTEDIDQLKNLWQDVFKDDMDYINSFFNCIYKSEYTLVAEINHIVVSCLYMIPYLYMQNGTTNKVMYLYALATDNSYRSNGIMSKLIQNSYDIAKHNNYKFQFLVPANDSLFDYYNKFGFSCMMSKKIYSVDCKNFIPNKFMEINELSLNAVWNEFTSSDFYKDGCIVPNQNCFNFYLDTIKKDGTKVLGVINGNSSFYAIINIKKDIANILQTNIDENYLLDFLGEIHNKYGINLANFIQPNKNILKGISSVCNISKYIMVRKIDNKAIWKINKLNNDWIYGNFILE